MSESEYEAVRANPLFRLAELAINLQTELRDSIAVKAILAQVRADADQAMEDLADTSPTDINAVSKLLVRVATLVYVRKSLNGVLMRGEAAEHEISARDQYQEAE